MIYARRVRVRVIGSGTDFRTREGPLRCTWCIDNTVVWCVDVQHLYSFAALGALSF